MELKRALQIGNQLPSLYKTIPRSILPLRRTKTLIHVFVYIPHIFLLLLEINRKLRIPRQVKWGLLWSFVNKRFFKSQSVNCVFLWFHLQNQQLVSVLKHLRFVLDWLARQNLLHLLIETLFALKFFLQTLDLRFELLYSFFMVKFVHFYWIPFVDLDPSVNQLLLLKLIMLNNVILEKQAQSLLRWGHPLVQIGWYLIFESLVAFLRRWLDPAQVNNRAHPKISKLLDRLSFPGQIVQNLSQYLLISRRALPQSILKQQLACFIPLLNEFLQLTSLCILFSCVLLFICVLFWDANDLLINVFELEIRLLFDLVHVGAEFLQTFWTCAVFWNIETDFAVERACHGFLFPSRSGGVKRVKGRPGCLFYLQCIWSRGAGCL